MNFKAFVVLVLSVAGFAACTEEADLENPITNIISPVSGDTLFVDDGLRLIATVDDDGELNQYKLSLIGNDALNGLIADSAISRIFVDNLSADEIYLERVFDVPDSLMNGHYTLSMSVLDQAGNESLADTSEFFFQNRNDTIQPFFIDTVIFDTISEIRGGLGVNIDVLDDHLVYVKLTVIHEDGITVLGEIEWKNIHYFWAPINEWFPFDASWPEGNFIIHVVAVDLHGYREHINTIYFDK
ncbi:MAG: hypothetical protein ACI9FU_000796 [Granulosicoccus sp.]|jgi:hypothetical protein